MSVNVFNTKVLNGYTHWFLSLQLETGPPLVPWSYKPREGLVVCSAKEEKERKEVIKVQTYQLVWLTPGGGGGGGGDTPLFGLN